MSMRKPGQYAPLSAHYADDERIMEAGEDAELLYVRMLAYAARTPMTEGWISDAVLHSRLGIIPRQAGNGAGNEPGTDAGSRAARLEAVGLVHRARGGWVITSWLKWNRSIEEMGRERTRDNNRKKSATSGDDGTHAGNDAGSHAGNDAGVPDADPLADQITDYKSEADSASEIADTIPDTAIVELREDVEELLDHLADRITGNGSKAPARNKAARDAMRLLIDKDGRPLAEVHQAIDWCQDSDFWRGNVLSAVKLREKYDQMRLQAQRSAQGKRTTTDRVRNGLQIAAEFAEADGANFPQINEGA